MFAVVREAGAGLVLMHMRGDPRTMQDDPRYDDVVAEVHEHLRERVEAALFAGLGADRLAVDPGIGFGKDLGHNLALLRALDRLADLDAALVLGASRKRFIGTLTGADDPADRLEGSLAAAVLGRGARGRRRARRTTSRPPSGRSRVDRRDRAGWARDAHRDRTVRTRTRSSCCTAGPAASHTWRRLAPLLATRFRVLAATARRRADLAAQAASVRERARRAAASTRFALVGHGHGGGVAQLVARDDPGTDALVLIDTVAFDRCAADATWTPRAFVERGSVEIDRLPSEDLDAYAAGHRAAAGADRPHVARRRDGVVGRSPCSCCGARTTRTCRSRSPSGSPTRCPGVDARRRPRQRALPARRRLRPGGRDDRSSTCAPGTRARRTATRAS